MIWTFILSSALAIVSYFLGGYFVKVAIYTGIAQFAVLLIVGCFVYYIYRRISRARRGGVRQIPPL